MWGGVIVVALYFVVITAPLLVLMVFRVHSPNAFVFEVARSIALSSFAILAMQPLLMARLKWIERPFGMDVVSRFHRSMGVFATVLLLLHPPVMAVGGVGFSLLTSLEWPWYIWLGRAGLVLLLIQTLSSLFWRSLGMKFEQWRLLHYILAPLIICLVLVHSWEAGDDLKETPIRVLWVVLAAVGLGIYVYHKVVRPAFLARAPYRVAAVEQETYNVWTVKLAPPDGTQIYPYQPGQFHFITFQRGEDLPVEEHHWTISSSPTEKQFVSSTIKESGDFTSTIKFTKPGDLAVVQGPFGRFSHTFHPQDKDLVFIAGGIGITPFMSMLRHMRDTNADLDVTLLCANRAEKDIVFRSELDQIAALERPRLKLIHVLSRTEQGWTGETGAIDRDKIQRFAGSGLEQKVFYVCGPPGMNTAVIATLRDMGVPYGRIRTEIFSL